MKFSLLSVVLALAGVIVGHAQTANPPPGAQFVTATVVFDNSARQVQIQMKEVMKEMADKLCSIPQSGVKLVNLTDEPGLLRGRQARGVFTCTAAPSDLEDVMDDCQDWYNIHELKDEIKDSTSFPNEIEVKSAKCTYGARTVQSNLANATDAVGAAGTTAANGATNAANTAATGVAAGAAGAGAAVTGAATGAANGAQAGAASVTNPNAAAALVPVAMTALAAAALVVMVLA